MLTWHLVNYCKASVYIYGTFTILAISETHLYKQINSKRNGIKHNLPCSELIRLKPELVEIYWNFK